MVKSGSGTEAQTEAHNLPVDQTSILSKLLIIRISMWSWCLNGETNSPRPHHLINLNIPNPLRYKLSYSCMDLGDVQTDVQIPVSAYELAERDLLFCKACPSRSQVSLPCWSDQHEPEDTVCIRCRSLSTIDQSEAWRLLAGYTTAADGYPGDPSGEVSR